MRVLTEGLAECVTYRVTVANFGVLGFLWNDRSIPIVKNNNANMIPVHSKSHMAMSSTSEPA